MKKGVLKKLVVFAVVFCMLLGTTACGKTVDLSFGEPVVVEKHVEFTVDNVLVSSQVFPPINNNNPMGWVMDDEDKTYVTIIASIKNLRDEAITTDDLWQNFCIRMNEEFVDGSIIALTTENGTILSDSASIEAGKTETVYFITQMDKADLGEAMSAEFDFGSTTLSLAVDATKKVAIYETLTMKDTYKVKNLGKVTPKKMAFMDELEPSNPGYTYDYYVPQTDDDKLLVLTTEVENTSKSKKASYRYFNIFAFAGDEEYLGDIVADDEYSANITGSEKIESGGTRQVYGIINLPKSVKKAACDIYVYIDGKYYQYVMK